MIEIIQRYNRISKEAKELSDNKVTLVVISKSFSFNLLKPLIDIGHLHFGENKVQETFNKWSETLNKNLNIQLHMVGKLQSNKASEAVNLFSYIHSLDNEKLAFRLFEKEKEYGKKLKYFVQINIGDENQKSGISKMHAADFIYFASKKIKFFLP